MVSERERRLVSALWEILGASREESVRLIAYAAIAETSVTAGGALYMTDGAVVDLRAGETVDYAVDRHLAAKRSDD